MQEFDSVGRQVPISPGIYNLDDLKDLGRRKGWCPYFLARYAVSTLLDLVWYFFMHAIDCCCFHMFLPSDSSRKHSSVQLPLLARSKNCRRGLKRARKEICSGVRRGSQHRWVANCSACHCHPYHADRSWLFQLILFPLDNVCIDSMSVNITRRTLDRCQTNVETLQNTISKCDKIVREWIYECLIYYYMGNVLNFLLVLLKN